jgi:ABC-type transporter Mla maintaining outer membrane lipid asymmetry ATPase subunit MlaF
MPLLKNLYSEEIDRLILEQGMALQNGAFDGLTVDEETARTISEIEQIMQEAMDSGNYAKLEEIKTDLNVLKSDVSSTLIRH